MLQITGNLQSVFRDDMAMNDSIELNILKKYTTKLETALRSVESNLVHFLHREGFLPDSIPDEILKPKSLWTDDQKAGELVKWIKHRVKQHPPSYHKLVAELKECGEHYHPIQKLLEDEYSKQQPWADVHPG